MPPRRPIRIPSRLAVGTLSLVASACTPQPGADVVDIIARDITDTVTPPDIIDATADNADVNTDGTTDGNMFDVPCDGPFGSPGWECLPDPHSDAAISCPYMRYCTSDQCPTGCLPCFATGFAPAGYDCIPDPHGDANVSCNTGRVCNPGDCPSWCVSCSEAAFCAPLPDSGVTLCQPSQVCNPADCPPGCEALV